MIRNYAMVLDYISVVTLTIDVIKNNDIEYYIHH